MADKEQPIHLCREHSNITACGQDTRNRAIEDSANWGEVTCGLCTRTTAFKRARQATNEQARTEGIVPKQETVGIPTTEDEREPVVHMSYAKDDMHPYCKGAESGAYEGFVTDDLAAVNCQWCKATMEFVVRSHGAEPPEDVIFEGDVLYENEEFERARRTDSGIDEEYEEPFEVNRPFQHLRDHFEQEDRQGKGVGRDHDAPFRPHPQQGKWTHDCDHCFFLDTQAGADLYYCRQSNGTSTVIARYGHEGGDYRSGIWNAKDDPMVALALAKAYHRGLLTADDLKGLL